MPTQLRRPWKSNLFGKYFLHILVSTTVPAPLMDAASIQKIFVEPMHYGGFYRISCA